MEPVNYDFNYFIRNFKIINSYVKGEVAHNEKEMKGVDKAIKELAKIAMNQLDENQQGKLRLVLEKLMQAPEEEIGERKVSIIRSIKEKADPLLQDLNRLAERVQGVVPFKGQKFPGEEDFSEEDFSEEDIYEKEAKLLEAEGVGEGVEENEWDILATEIERLSNPNANFEDFRKNLSPQLTKKIELIEKDMKREAFLIEQAELDPNSLKANKHHQKLVNRFIEYTSTIFECFSELRKQDFSSEIQDQLLESIIKKLEKEISDYETYLNDRLRETKKELENHSREFLNTPYNPPEKFQQNYETFQNSLEQFKNLKKYSRDFVQGLQRIGTNISSKESRAVGRKVQDLLKTLNSSRKENEEAGDIDLTSLKETIEKSQSHYRKQVAKYDPKKIWLNQYKEMQRLIPSATQLQRGFRRRQMRKKIKNIGKEQIGKEQIIQQKEKAQEYSTIIETRVREPLVDLKKSEAWVSGDDAELAQTQKAMTKATQAKSYNKFVKALRSSFSHTLQSIYESPQREYIILADKQGKSTNWVASHLHDMLSLHPPLDIIPKFQVHQFLKDHPNVKHIVMLDDGAYSGEQASRYILSLFLPPSNYQFHVTIPYMTSAAKKTIFEALLTKKVTPQIHDVELMLSYEQLMKMGKIFSLTGKVLIDTEDILNFGKLPKEESSQAASTINQKLEDLKTGIRENKDREDLYKMIMEILFYTNSYIDDVGIEGLQLMQKLLKTMHLEGNEEQERKLREKYIENVISELEKHYNMSADSIDDYYAKTFEMRTPFWFAHKGADGMSTNEIEMMKIVGEQPIEPYRDLVQGPPYRDLVQEREKQLRKIKNEMPGRTLEETITSQDEYAWLNGRVDFVETNRGFFLLGNSYVREMDDRYLLLHIDGAVIELGGEEGEYQYKLKKGDKFELEDPESGQKITLKLDETGKLLVIR